LALAASAATAQAGIRGAASKIFGNYDSFDSPSNARATQTYAAPRATFVEPSAGARGGSVDAARVLVRRAKGPAGQRRSATGAGESVRSAGCASDIRAALLV